MAKPFTRQEVEKAGSLREAYRIRAKINPEEMPYWKRIERYGPKKKRKTPLIDFVGKRRRKAMAEAMED